MSEKFIPDFPDLQQAMITFGSKNHLQGSLRN